MRMANDLRAVESIPLRLMIVAVVVGLSVLPAADALDTFRNRDFVRRAALVLEAIIAEAQVMAIQGPGNVRTIAVDMRGEGSLRFESFTIGDSSDGPNLSSAVLRFVNGGVLTRSAVEPVVWLRGASGTGLTVDRPVFELRLESVLEERALSIVAEAR